MTPGSIAGSITKRTLSMGIWNRITPVSVTPLKRALLAILDVTVAADATETALDPRVLSDITDDAELARHRDEAISGFSDENERKLFELRTSRRQYLFSRRGETGGRPPADLMRRCPGLLEGDRVERRLIA
mmetsp:Transcript_33907/g.49859  ORF Transcript_33907/g.49859 Transcript_33907/m.49859 type:complete len:131 (+) Transcript_33907:603-995(+)